MLRYRALMEKHLGRKLLATEQIHHINRDTSDNRIENLQVVTASEHAKIHNEILPIHKLGSWKRKPMKIFQLYLTHDQLKALKELSKKIDRSVAELIRTAIDNFLSKKN